MVPLAMLSVSYDARAGPIRVTSQKNYDGPHFDHLDLRTVLEPLMVLSTSHGAYTIQWYHMTATAMPVTLPDASVDVSGIT